MLTPKRQRFIEEYLIDLNGTQAAIRAGYSARTANRIATEILSKPDIQRELAARRAALSEKTELTAEWIVRQLKVEATLHGEGSTHSARVQALTTLAKINGVLTDRIKLEGGVKVACTDRPLNLNQMNEEQLSQLRSLLRQAVTSGDTGSDAGAIASGD